MNVASQMSDITWLECMLASQQPLFALPSVPSFICSGFLKPAFYPHLVPSVWYCIWALLKMIRKHSIHVWQCWWALDFWLAIQLVRYLIWWSPSNRKLLWPHWLERLLFSYHSVAQHCWPNVAVSYFWAASSWAYSVQWHYLGWPTFSFNRKWFTKWEIFVLKIKKLKKKLTKLLNFIGSIVHWSYCYGRFCIVWYSNDHGKMPSWIHRLHSTFVGLVLWFGFDVPSLAYYSHSKGNQK